MDLNKLGFFLYVWILSLMFCRHAQMTTLQATSVDSSLFPSINTGTVILATSTNSLLNMISLNLKLNMKSYDLYKAISRIFMQLNLSKPNTKSCDVVHTYCVFYTENPSTLNTLRTGWKNPFRWVGTQLR